MRDQPIFLAQSCHVKLVARSPPLAPPIAAGSLTSATSIGCCDTRRHHNNKEHLETCGTYGAPKTLTCQTRSCGKNSDSTEPTKCPTHASSLRKYNVHIDRNMHMDLSPLWYRPDVGSREEAEKLLVAVPRQPFAPLPSTFLVRNSSVSINSQRAHKDVHIARIPCVSHRHVLVRSVVLLPFFLQNNICVSERHVPITFTTTRQVR